MNLPENSDAVCWRFVEGFFGTKKRVVTSSSKVSSEAGGEFEFAEGLFGVQKQTRATGQALRSLVETLDSVAGFI